MDYFDILLAKKLNGGGGGDVTIEQLDVSENGTYSESGKAYSPVVVNVPQPTIEDLTITANGEYIAPSGKAFGKVTANVPAPSNAIYKQTLSNLPSPIATFTGADAPIDSLKASIEGVQDLHGYDKPWVGGAGKNKLPYPYYNTTQTVSGVTYTDNGDGTINVNGTRSGGDEYGFICFGTSTAFLLKAGSYIVSGCPSGGSPDTYSLHITDGVNISLNDYGDGVNLTIAVDTYIRVYIWTHDGNTYNNLLFKPMIRPSGTTADFTPYSNICPISGWSSCEVTRTGKNMLDETAGVAGFFKSDGSIQSSQAWKYQYIKVNPNTNYTISNIPASVPAVYFCWFDINKNFISNSGSHNNGTITSPNNAVYLGFCVNQNSELGANIQMEAGDQASTYESYSGNTYTITFTDGQGQSVEVYGGSVDVVSGVLTVDRAIVTYSDSTWFANHSSDRWYRNGLPSGADYNKRTQAISNSASYQDVQYTYGALFAFGSSGVYVNKLDSEETIEQFNARLQANPMQICYKLATPQTYQLTPIALRSNGVTNISVDCGEVTECKFFSETP